MDDREALLARIARLEALVAEQAATIAELKAELRWRGKKFVPQANAKSPPEPQRDRRAAEFRQHPGQTRAEPAVTAEPMHHDVTVERCPGCGAEMAPTGEFTDHFVEEIPKPTVEVHRYDAQGKRKRRVVYGKTKQELQDKLTRLQGQKLDGTLGDPCKLRLSEYLRHWLPVADRPRTR